MIRTVLIIVVTFGCGVGFGISFWTCHQQDNQKAQADAILKQLIGDPKKYEYAQPHTPWKP